MVLREIAFLVSFFCRDQLGARTRSDDDAINSLCRVNFGARVAGMKNLSKLLARLDQEGQTGLGFGGAS